VVKNEMTLDALNVVYAKDGSHLLISCNRLLGKTPTPECGWTTTTTTTTTRSTTRIYNEAVVNENNSQNTNDFIGEIIGGVISGILAIVAIILLILFLRQRKKLPHNSEVIDHQPPTTATMVQETKNLPEKEKIPLEERVSLLTASEVGAEDEDDGEEEDQRPKIAKPIWLEEIQANKIFNRQKSLLSEDRLNDIAEGNATKIQKKGVAVEVEDEPLPPPPPLPEEPEEEFQDLPEVQVNGLDHSSQDNQDDDIV
jgi:hypothetical protein